MCKITEIQYGYAKSFQLLKRIFNNEYYEDIKENVKEIPCYHHNPTSKDDLIHSLIHYIFYVYSAFRNITMIETLFKLINENKNNLENNILESIKNQLLKVIDDYIESYLDNYYPKGSFKTMSKYKSLDEIMQNTLYLCEKFKEVFMTYPKLDIKRRYQILLEYDKKYRIIYMKAFHFGYTSELEELLKNAESIGETIYPKYTGRLIFSEEEKQKAREKLCSELKNNIEEYYKADQKLRIYDYIEIVELLSHIPVD